MMVQFPQQIAQELQVEAPDGSGIIIAAVNGTASIVFTNTGGANLVQFNVNTVTGAFGIVGEAHNNALGHPVNPNIAFDPSGTANMVFEFHNFVTPPTGTEGGFLKVNDSQLFLGVTDLLGLNATTLTIDGSNMAVAANLNAVLTKDLSWSTLSLMHGFTAGSQAGWNSGIRYRMLSNGDVVFDGIVSCPGSPAGVIMGQFLVPYVPQSNQIGHMLYLGNTPKIADWLVDTSGNFTFLADYGNPAGAFNAYFTGRFSTL